MTPQSPAASHPASPFHAPSRPDRISPYQAYVYAYPHKTAYRPLDPRPALRDVWAAEPTDALFLYVHVPYCEMRCGFCNLFTRTGADEDQVTAYLDALERQARTVRDALGDRPRYARAAVGGGTPTFLTAAELTRLFDIAGRVMGMGRVPLSVETSPATATPDRLAVLAERGTDRISIGVQSFIDAEAHAAGRPQRRAEVERALSAIREGTTARLNIDLIYGIGGQTSGSWRHSLDAALAWRPEELYLYPLYVRPLTGLGRRGVEWDDQRLRLYREARDHLLDNGYVQESMRMFRRADVPGEEGPAYCCQTDGMVGLGCGARSYTGDLHYSFDYAVGVAHVRAILDDYVRRDDFRHAEVGFRLDDDERRRRHLVQSLLHAEGLDTVAYRARFGTEATDDFPAELAALDRRGWSAAEPGRLVLTPDGLAHSDAIGPAFFSARVRALMEGHDPR